MATRIPFVLLVPVVALLPGSLRGAVVCGPTPAPCAEFSAAKAVFLGTVKSVNERPGLVRMEVEESFKGVAPGTREVWIDPEWSGPGAWVEDPGPSYRAGERWLVFASAFDAEYWRIRHPVVSLDLKESEVFSDSSRCQEGSRLSNSRGTDSLLMELRAYRDGKPIPRVAGYLGFDPYPPIVPTSGATVRVSDASRQYETKSRDDGTYSLFGLAPGKYNVSVEMQHLSVKPPQQRVVVPATGCGIANFTLAARNEIGGVLLDQKGQPVEGVKVRAVPAGVPEQDVTYLDRLEGTTDAAGKFRIRRLPPVDMWLLAAGTPDSESWPYGDVYYPGVHGQHQAVAFRVGPSGKKTGLNIQMPSQLEIVHVSIRASYPDGRPAAQFTVEARFARPTVGRVEPARGYGGTAKFRCLKGLPYEVRAVTQDYPEGVPGNGETRPTAYLSSEWTPISCEESQTPDLRLHAAKAK